ncbi:MAG TPA: hypothetical protein VI138_02685 [Candidatus Dormibacteraeota bacterium]
MLPPLGLLAVIYRYGVNVPNTDDWSIVALLQRLDTGHLTLSALWAQHFESRVLFSNLLYLGLASASRADLKIDMYVSWLLLAGSCLGVVWLIRRQTGLGWWWFLPAFLVLFSLDQYAPVLSAFQLCLYLALPCLVVMVGALLAANRRPGLLVLAVLAAVVGSYSTSQGLALWPVGLLLLVCTGQPVRRAVVWVVATALTVAVYLEGYSAAATGGSAGWIAAHPGAAGGFYLELMGGIVPRSGHVGVSGAEQAALGFALSVASLILIGLAVRRRGRAPWLLVPTSLVAFSVAVGLLTTSGRAQFGVGYALTPRYGLFSLWDLVGVWLGLALLWRALGPRWVKAGLTLVALVVALQVALSLHEGVVGARHLHATRETAASVVRDYGTASSAEVTHYVFGQVHEFRQLAAFLQRRRLSVFAPGPAPSA